jgi:hypothetical protein
MGYSSWHFICGFARDYQRSGFRIIFSLPAVTIGNTAAILEVLQ